MNISEQELAEIEKWCGAGDMLAPLTPQLATILRLTEEIRRLRSALEFYSRCYEVLYYRDTDGFLLDDEGQRARDALGEKG